MKGLKRLYQGDFNSMDVECLHDGSQIITLHKEGEDKVYKFRVRDLYGPNEKEVDIDTGKPITKRDIQ